MLRETALNDGLELHSSASRQLDFSADADSASHLSLSASLNSASQHFDFAPDELLASHDLSVSADFQQSTEYTTLPYLDISADPFAGQTAPNGKIIYSPEEAADNLNRYEVNYTFGNNGALDDGVLTFGFWQSLEEVQNSYYMEPMTDPETGEQFLVADAQYLAAGYFAPFTAEQQAMAIQNIGLWDDLISVTFQQADSASEADITFGFVPMSAAAGAHAYYPQEEAWNDYYGTTESGQISGDVWANWLYSGNYNPNINDFADTQAGSYAWFAITHELGHTLGLAHGGDYNASDDNDGDGKPDPITYAGDAYFYQDSQQYTIMSYFSGRATGQAAIEWTATGGTFAMAQTPAVHDILAVQNVYGADHTTRADDTVYGFNSTADRDIYDFTQNDVPLLTIWDGGGNDTLDLSGFDANNVIDINDGAFSSAGYKINDESLAFWASRGIDTQAELDSFFARNGVGPDGRPVDNIAIAYGANIENAIGGSGNDRIIGNGLDNRIAGGDGFDVITLGGGHDTFVAELGTRSASKVGNVSWDVITDFSAGDKIDLSELDQLFNFRGTSANKNDGDLTYKVYTSVTGAENALGIDIDGHDGASGISGPVTVVFANVDGGQPDIGLILLDHNGVTANDFIFA